ncbi:MAG: multidrug transporter AcrB [Candidatus Cloacimonetes bacterium 4572_65]|nr:MAG: multidrug transporter AcrB [Candidatus Cloacimonetes bacterium 4572_65]
MNLTDFAFKNKRLVYFLIFIISLTGIYSFFKISKLEDPEIKVKKAVVVTYFPGADPNRVELEITKVIEDEIRTIGDIEKLTSRSLANYSEIMIALKSTVDEDDVEQKWDSLRRKVSRAAMSLPKGSYAPVVVDDFGDIYGMFYAITADGYSYEELSDFTDKIKRELLAIEGVRRIAINGTQDYAINVKLNVVKMANLGVLPAEILVTLNSQDKISYSGYYENDQSRIRLDVNNAFNSVEDIGNVIIKGHENDRLCLRDIASIEKEIKLPIKNKMLYNKKEAIGLSISMEDGYNIINLGKAVEKRLDELKSELPIGVKFNKIFYQPEKVDSAINQFMVNLIESILIVIGVLLFAMGFKSALLIGRGLIFTILASFTVLYILGGTLQRVSLAAIIVAMGMLVDNAIVVVDGILVDLQNGVEREKALRDSAKKTALPLLGATLIAIISFLPIFLSPDTAGTYTKDLFIVLAVTLLFSWIFALVQIPIGAATSIKSPKNNKAKKESIVLRKFRLILQRAFRYRKTAIAIAIVLLLVSLYCYKFITQAFFPNFTYNQFYVEFKLPETTKIEKVEADLMEINDYLTNFSEVTNVTTNLGGTPTRYNLVRTISESSKSYGELIVDFKDYKSMMKLKDTIQLHLTQNYPNAKSRIRMYNLIVNSNYSVEALFKGTDITTLRNLANQAKDIMRESDYSMNISDNWEPQGKLLLADYNQTKARKSGIDRGEISTALMMATDGVPAGVFYDGEDKLPIIVKSVSNDGSKIGNLKDIPVWSMLPNLSLESNSLKRVLTGSKSLTDIKEEVITSVPLSSVTNGINLKSYEEVIRRYNGSRAIIAQCDPAPGYKGSVIFKDVKSKIEDIELPEGYTLEWKGEQYDQKNAMKYIIMFLPIAAILIVTILIMLFNSYKKMVIILLSIPFALIGVIPGMIFTGKEFGFVSIVGLIGLIGMLIKNGVVLIDAIDYDIKIGKTPYKAVFDSAIIRMRPVIMASLTTILGMIPLIPDPMFGSLAITIMTGLLVGTVIILVLVPILYTLFFNIKPITNYTGK